MEGLEVVAGLVEGRVVEGDDGRVVVVVLGLAAGRDVLLVAGRVVVVDGRVVEGDDGFTVEFDGDAAGLETAGVEGRETDVEGLAGADGAEDGLEVEGDVDGADVVADGLVVDEPAGRVIVEVPPVLIEGRAGVEAALPDGRRPLVPKEGAEGWVAAPTLLPC